MSDVVELAWDAPVRAAEDLSWQDRALCGEVDPSIFFPESGESASEAKKVCAGCEVRPECLEYALAYPSLEGVWGGMSERERLRHAGRLPALTAVEPVTEGEKDCTKCGDTKPLTAFGVDRYLPGGRKYWCRACFAAYRAEREGVAA